MNTEVTATSYCTELPHKDYSKIIDKEKESEESGTWNTLCEDLEKIESVIQVDYNGHFGPNIFFTVEEDNRKNDTISKRS